LKTETVTTRYRNTLQCLTHDIKGELRFFKGEIKTKILFLIKF